MKKFIEFKEEIIKRAKEKRACSNEYKRALSAQNFEELIKVITDNFSWCCNNSIIDVDLLKNVGSEILSPLGLYYNKSVNSGFLLASGHATVKACGNATVKACGNAIVEAWENATVKACENVTVAACGNAIVR